MQKIRIMSLGDENTLRRNAGFLWFLIGYFVFLVAGGCILLGCRYGDVVLWVNEYSRVELDSTIEWITRLGLGSTAVIFSLSLGTYRLRYAIMLLFNLALLGIVSVVFKNLLLPDLVRPLKYFDPQVFSRMVSLHDYNLLHSFPSGHSMTIFAMTSMVAYFFGKRTVGICCILIAVLVGFSRIYLLQHFFVDVYFGSLFGVLCTFFTIWLGDFVIKLNKIRLFREPVLYYRLKHGFTSFFW